MADDKNARDEQARNAERRQREREMRTALERRDEPEPVDPADLTGIESELESLQFPAKGSEIVETVGDREIESVEGTCRIADLVPETETFDAPDAVRVAVERPTVAAAMKRILEASADLQNESLRGSQRKAYEKTFRELQAIDAVDEDEGIEVVADWIVERINEKGKLPGSRAVRRQAAKVCQQQGYQVRNAEWLGI